MKRQWKEPDTLVRQIYSRLAVGRHFVPCWRNLEITASIRKVPGPGCLTGFDWCLVGDSRWDDISAPHARGRAWSHSCSDDTSMKLDDWWVATTWNACSEEPWQQGPTVPCHSPIYVRHNGKQVKWSGPKKGGEINIVPRQPGHSSYAQEISTRDSIFCRRIFPPYRQKRAANSFGRSE